LLLLCAVLLPGAAGAAKVATDPAVIKALAADAYVWGLGPEYIYRFSKYNTIVAEPFNKLKYGVIPAAWNNEATNAGDASVLYIGGFVNFDVDSELVLTVPPSQDQYYVVAYYDAYGNTIGSIGTRTTPSSTTTSYLLVGPRSPYAGKKSVTIRGYQYPVMASDTTVNWILIRVLANTLIDASDPSSMPNVLNGVARKIALNTLQAFERNGHQPVYPSNFITPPPTDDQNAAAEPYRNAPDDAVDFFAQLGSAVVTNPIPNRGTGLSGTALTDLPSWVAPQYGAQAIYLVPSYGQKEKLATFAPIGLTEKGFQQPAGWGQAQLDALQAGYDLGRTTLQKIETAVPAGPSTNYWAFLNDLVGTYPNDTIGYILRSVIVLEGGVANLPVDAVYPTLTGNPDVLDGNHTYKMTFTLPASYQSPDVANGIYPPMVSDGNGNPKGFWSIHVYAVDPKEGAAPFIAQTSVLNTHFSVADTEVVSVNAAADTMTVRAPNWGTLKASMPILFGANATSYGLSPGAVYYVADVPVDNGDGTFTIHLSSQWLQPLSEDYVPIQGPNGQPGPIDHPNVDLAAGTAPLTYGMVKPVTQHGSTELASGLLQRNADQSLTLWFGPTLPHDAPASNWIPTPSSAYYGPLYPGVDVSTKFQLTLRMYYAQPGDSPPSILPCNVCGANVPQTYIPPVVELVQ
jgi:hypothetical protein